MKPLENRIEAVERYLDEVLGVRGKIRPWKRKAKLPFFMVDYYAFYETSLLGHSCLLMIAQEGSEVTPAKIRKHWELAQSKYQGLCIYVPAAITSYNRKRIIEHRVPFIVPGNQMYLPDLGIDLREYFRKLRTTKKSFSPATQLVVIYALLHGTDKRYVPSELARELGYTSMTLTRVFDELEMANIGIIHRTGRERWWIFVGNKRELWEQTKPLMRSPVKYRTWIKGKAKTPKLQAGESALSQFSMLNQPNIPIYAISGDEWKNWKNAGIKELPMSEDASFELEIWHYNPNLFAENDFVDPFSLYLSLKETTDERIEIALEEMVE